ncbi:hypothetical protein FKW77_009023 [Venturia effusa]|uniref:Ig-like domain-containing protein n=1 Tax=Venturia effusa TaxID=50376 RepID=A0A517L406_9PEZI|nr:hypothetical protein FKW77_009023 [Venturia effusa]
MHHLSAPLALLLSVLTTRTLAAECGEGTATPGIQWNDAGPCTLTPTGSLPLGSDLYVCSMNGGTVVHSQGRFTLTADTMTKATVHVGCGKIWSKLYHCLPGGHASFPVPDCSGPETWFVKKVREGIMDHPRI